MSENINSRLGKVNENGKAVLISLVEHNGSCNTAEIKENCNSNSVLPELSNADINYQVRNRLNNGNDTVSGLELVTTRNPPQDENSNESKPKIVEIRPQVREEVEDFVEEIQETLDETSIEGFDTIEGALKSLTENVASNSEGVESNSERIEEVVEQFKEAAQVRNEQIEKLERRVEKLEQENKKLKQNGDTL